MSSDEYDHFEKLFDGRAWKYDHGENMEAFMDAAGKSRFVFFLKSL